MSNKKISQLNSATTANDSDLIPIVQSGETKSITKSILFADVGISSQTFNYQLSGSASSGDIGKLMMQKWEGEGDLDRATVYQEDTGQVARFVMEVGLGNPVGIGAYLYVSWWPLGVYHEEVFTEGVDWTANADPALQLQSIIAAMTARSGFSDAFTFEDAGVLWETPNTLLMTAKGNFYVNFWNSWCYNDYLNSQYGYPGGPFPKALGKLVSIEEDGWCTIQPFNGQSFIAVGAIAKNEQIVGTDNGKVRARTGDNSQDCVIGLAKEAVLDGEVVTLNYCPRTPEAWLDYGDDNRLPTTVQEAMDMFMWLYWD